MALIHAIQEIVTFPQFLLLFNFLSHICIEKVPPEKSPNPKGNTSFEISCG